MRQREFHKGFVVGGSVCPYIGRPQLYEHSLVPLLQLPIYNQPQPSTVLHLQPHLQPPMNIVCLAVNTHPYSSTELYGGWNFMVVGHANLLLTQIITYTWPHPHSFPLSSDHTHLTTTSLHLIPAPSVPLNVGVEGVTAEALCVMWEEPADNGGRPVLEYSIVVGGTVMTVDATETMILLRNSDDEEFLVENTTYT